jgi:hypothetical protein
MVFRRISRAVFNHLLSAHRALAIMIGREVEWFANRAGTLIGTIALDHRHTSWNHVILRRVPHGDFHVCAVMRHMYNVKAARTDLMYALKAAVKHGHEKVLPHRD